MHKSTFEIRIATIKDAKIIHGFIKKLAHYEKMDADMIASVQDIKTSIFIRHEAEVLLAYENQIPIGFALFFQNYSTFLGRANIFLEDLFIDPEHRGHGYGKALLKRLAEIAVERGCQRLDWMCLDWNQPSIDFYNALGAIEMSNWKTFRLKGDALIALAKK
jgi:GNAT superfamily N-acetyltransferase